MIYNDIFYEAQKAEWIKQLDAIFAVDR